MFANLLIHRRNRVESGTENSVLEIRVVRSYLKDPNYRWNINAQRCLYLSSEALKNMQNFKCLNYELTKNGFKRHA
jgi:hypothetical protein